MLASKLGFRRISDWPRSISDSPRPVSDSPRLISGQSQIDLGESEIGRTLFQFYIGLGQSKIRLLCPGESQIGRILIIQSNIGLIKYTSNVGFYIGLGQSKIGLNPTLDANIYIKHYNMIV